MKSILTWVAAVALVALTVNLALAQNESQSVQQLKSEKEALTAKLTGDWTMDMEQSKKVMTEDEFAKAKEGSAAGAFFLSFKADKTFVLAYGDRKLPADMTFEITPVDAETGKFLIVVEGRKTPMKAKAFFVNKDTLQLAPENDGTIILVRVVAQDGMGKEALTAKLFGDWTIDLKKSKEVMSEVDFARMKAQLDKGVSKLSFKTDKTFELTRGGKKLSVDMTFELEPILADAGKFSIIVKGRTGPMNCTCSFIDRDTLKLSDEIEGDFVLVRTKEKKTGNKKPATNEEREDLPIESSNRLKLPKNPSLPPATQ